MYPILISIGSFNLHTYGVLVALGVLAAIMMFRRECATVGIDRDEATDLAVYIILLSLAGARIFYVLSDLAYYRDNPAEIIFSRSGFVFYGGFLIGGAAGFLMIRRKKLPFWPLADAVALAISLGHGIGRLGCFFQGCCYGRITTTWMGIHFPETSTVADCIGVDPLTGMTPPVVPTQLIESIGLLLIFTILFLYRLSRPKHLPGFLIIMYGIMYSCLRFTVELLRGDFRGIYLYWFSLSQWISLCVIALGIGLYFLRRRQTPVV